MYRIIPLRNLRRTSGVKFDEIVPSDIPKIDGIDRVIHGPNAISPGPVGNVKRPWYMHPNQDDNLMVLQGTRFVDIYDSNKRCKTSFIITPDQVYKNGKLYCDYSAMIVWPAKIFHRIITGDEGSISVNFSTRHKGFDLSNNFDIYNLDVFSGDFLKIKDGIDDQPDLSFKYSSEEYKKFICDE
jgi:hypothetical protein